MSVVTSDRRAVSASALAAELRAIIGKLKRRLRGLADAGDLRPSEVSVLLRLEKEGPTTMSKLARAEGMRPQSMRSIILALKTSGLVSTAPDPKDGRQEILSLTKTCRKWIQEGLAAREDWLFRTIQARLSPQEQEHLAASVELLKRFVDD
jgi:DNA-binding MarR family transcriptional regulator